MPRSSPNTDQEKAENNTGDMTTLYLSFLSPFRCQGKVHTAFTKKFFNIEILSTANSLSFELKNHKLILQPCDSPSQGNGIDSDVNDANDRTNVTYGINLLPVQGNEDIMVRQNIRSTAS